MKSKEMCKRELVRTLSHCYKGKIVLFCTITDREFGGEKQNSYYLNL